MSTTVAFLVTDAAKAGVVADIAALTPANNIDIGVKVAAITPAMTWSEPPTHWYASAGGVSAEVVAEWQEYAATADGLVLFVAINADNPYAWAVTNLASQGLQLVPPQEID